MKRMMMVLGVAAALAAGSRVVSYANGTSGPSMQRSNSSDHSAYERGQEIMALYNQGIQAGKDNDYQKAIGFFEDALKKDPDNADVLNMLAHAQRKTGLIDGALENYKKALAIRPRFAEAREYLGETYLQAALRERDILKSYGDSGKEQLEDLTEAIQEAAAGVKKGGKEGEGKAEGIEPSINGNVWTGMGCHVGQKMTSPSRASGP